jgi:hypothetical protein
MPRWSGLCRSRQFGKGAMSSVAAIPEDDARMPFDTHIRRRRNTDCP